MRLAISLSLPAACPASQPSSSCRKYNKINSETLALKSVKLAVHWLHVNAVISEFNIGGFVACTIR